MRRKANVSLPKSKDPLFYYETKTTYEEKIAYNKRSKSEETGKAVKSALRSYHTFLINKMGKTKEKLCFEDYSKSNLFDYQIYLVNELGNEPATVNQRISLIRGLLEYASDLDDSLMMIYLKSRKIKKLTVPTKPIEYFTEEQIENLLQSQNRNSKIGRRNTTILTIEYDAALRIHEIPLLKLKDLHLKSDPKIMVHGKGGTYLPVPLTDAAADLLKQYIKEFHEESKPDTPLFYGMYGKEKKSISEDTISNIIKSSAEICRNKNIVFPERTHSHMFRKSRAMHLYEYGVSLPHIQQILRHKSLNTTSGFYAFATLKKLRESIEAADENREKHKKKKWLDPEIMKNIDDMTKE